MSEGNGQPPDYATLEKAAGKARREWVRAATARDEAIARERETAAVSAEADKALMDAVKAGAR